jgi:inner membrane protein involved in colicin E2 resistance
MRPQNSPILIKATILAAIAVLLLIALQLLQGLLAERGSERGAAVAQVSRGWGGPQLLSGPLRAIPVSSARDPGHTHDCRQRRPLPPIQYGLLALALSVFYLLLLSLAEHVGFGRAYLLASGALCALLGVYRAGALRSNRAGSSGTAIMATSYGLLYVLVTAEGYALLASAVALFALLAAVMLVTRRLNGHRRERDSDPTLPKDALAQ